MVRDSKWITPFLKQCFVTCGVSINLSGYGLIVGYASILLPQLRMPNSPIPIDDDSGSWIASIMGFALIVGNFLVPPVSAKFGRKNTNLISVGAMIFSWLSIVMASSIPALLISRFFQGVALGMGSSVGPVLIGEYTSPKNRGAFLMTISLAIATGVLIVHTVGVYSNWQVTALVCACICFVNLLIVIYSPESPSWLADQGRYDDCKKSFRWLRGDSEEEELKRIIESSIVIRENRDKMNKVQTFSKKVKANLSYLKVTIKKKEFYKPIIIMINIYIMGQWAGANVLAAYTLDIYHTIIGNDINEGLLIITVDVQRIISNICAVYVIRKIKRRTMLFVTFGINLIAFIITAAYAYAKLNNMLPFDHPVIGIFLIHLHMFSIATGTTPLQFTLAGELFPLEYRSLAGVVSVFFFSINLFLTVKTVPYLFTTVGLPGAYSMYAIIVGVCLVVVGIMMPETKDKTLQEIEDEFRGKPLKVDDWNSGQPLATWKVENGEK